MKEKLTRWIDMSSLCLRKVRQSRIGWVITLQGTCGLRQEHIYIRADGQTEDLAEESLFDQLGDRLDDSRLNG